MGNQKGKKWYLCVHLCFCMGNQKGKKWYLCVHLCFCMGNQKGKKWYLCVHLCFCMGVQLDDTGNHLPQVAYVLPAFFYRCGAPKLLDTSQKLILRMWLNLSSQELSNWLWLYIQDFSAGCSNSIEPQNDMLFIK